MAPGKGKRIKSPRASLPSLPLSVFSLVMEFAVSDYDQPLLPRARSPPGKYLRDVALVSKSWLHSVQQLTTQYNRETMAIRLKLGGKEEIKNIQQKVALGGAAVRDLRVFIGKEEKYSFGTPDYTLLSTETERVNVDWDSMLMEMPGLRRLDLGLVPLESKHLPKLVRAAGKHCLQLEILVLPRKAKQKKTVKGKKIEVVMKELYAAMGWFLKGGRGGLKQLTVPTRDEAKPHRSGTEFLENVAKFCPSIEYLDGSESAFDGCEGVRCEDKWMVSLETWEKFNRACTSLREFHWAPVPFADPFFRVFGEYPKPQLENLSITANLLWSWKEYLQSCGDETAAAIKDCYGKRAKHIAAVFSGCPELTNLTVGIDLQDYTDSPTRHFKIDAFGDEFWGAVAAHCPLLERFAIRNCANFEVLSVSPIRTFTDAALLSLADLEYLYSIETNAAVMCTGNGFFEYMHRVLAANTCYEDWRLLELSLGGQENGFFGVPRFYTVVIDLLRRLAEISEEDFGAAASSQKLDVYLSNPYHTKVSQQWSAVYMREQLRPLMNRVKEVHPSLSLNASVLNRSRDSFTKMDMFSLSWHPRNADRDMFYNSVDDTDYGAFSDPSDHMPPGMQNLFNELLGYNSQGGDSESDSDEDGDGGYIDEINQRDNFWGL
ncbi:hypothetical protein PF010_g12546 [Phytophthora fragariae]|uniref:Uncharacterized protein n=1 Tax=Phytophthora fragariae TaxID=53985 RepID=A0A6A3KWL1_9STRA|nr:hypothetical protein PF011_g9195 [Phytophthora fragariae]KAE9106651.1 hypothetical protein PF010_g12546 [Phytophthora fragariae]